MTNTLLVNFFEETSSTFSASAPSQFSSNIRLNPEHEIYKGHFTQMPIAPGVCLVQMVKEILMDKFQCPLILSEGKNIKYLALINPTQNVDFRLDFTVQVSENTLDASVNILSGESSFTKMKLIFKK